VAHDLLIRSFAGVPNARRFEHVVVEYASQIAMVAEGMGVALVPRMGRGAVPDTVRVLPVEPTPTRQVYAVWRSLRGARPALRAAVLALRESFADTVAETAPRSRPAEAVLVAQAAADRIASDSWKALKRCPVAKLASMPDRNTNAGASLDGCTMPIFIFSV